MAFHMNAGASVGGVSREVFWSTAAAFAVTPRVTFAAETMVRLTSELSRVSQVYQPSAERPGIETMRWLEGDRGVRSSFFVVGAKWNVARSWLVNSGLLVRLTDTGLRSRVTPIVSLDRAFQR